MEQFIKRLKSFGWRAGIAAIGFLLLYFTDHIGELGLPGVVTIGVAYILGEVTKWWNTKMQLAGRGFFGGRKV